MIEILIKNVFENSNKIDAIVKHINKTDKKHCMMFLLIAANVLITSKIIKSQEEKIDQLETVVKTLASDLEEIESKGE